MSKLNNETNTLPMHIDEHLARMKNNSPASWAKFCHDIGMAHNINVVYGDLRGEKILVFETPSGFVCKLDDLDSFGDVYTYGLTVWQIKYDDDSPFENRNLAAFRRQGSLPQVLYNDLEESIPDELRKVIRDATTYKRGTLDELKDIFENFLNISEKNEQAKADVTIFAHRPIAQASTITENSLASVNFLENHSLSDEMKKRIFDDFEREALANDNDLAMSSMVLCYHYGYGVERDDEKAAEICTVLAKRDDTNAQYNLGWFLINGVIEDRREEAEHWFRKAAEKNHIQAEVYLGIINTGREEYAKAEKNFLKASRAQDAYANYNLGLLYHSTSLLKDHRKAISCYEKAAEAGIGKAMLKLGALYRDSIPYDASKVEEWFKKAVNAKCPGAAFELGIFYHDMKNHRMALEQFQKAFDDGDDRTPYRLGLVFFAIGEFSEAQKWSLLALGVKPGKPSKFGVLDSSRAFELGIAYEIGLGVRQNLEMAKKFYETAAKNNVHAKRHLQTLSRLSYESHDHSLNTGKPCRREFTLNEEFYMCLTCGSDATALCSTCFYETDHLKHNVVIMFTPPGEAGCCDCGEETVWKADIACHNHRPYGRPYGTAKSGLISKIRNMLRRVLRKLFLR